MAGSDHEGHRRRRFQPFKKLQKLFRRKGKAGEDDDPTEPSGLPEAPPSPQAQRRRSGKGASSPNKYRLSMSHDSIFQTGEEPAAGMDSAASIPSLPSSSSRLAAELRSVLTKKRADEADDDSGLPRSPASPPGGPLHASKNQTVKSGGSCSDGSMLSVYSSGTGTDDDIFGPLSENSSRLSLSRDQDSLELRPPGALSHAAAKHRIAVRPKRNHGASRPRRPGRSGPPQASLPATVEEEVPTPEQSTAVSSAVQNVQHGGQGVSGVGADRGRATLPAAGVAERATPVQRSRSTIADRRLRDLSPRKLWGRDGSEPAPEKKSEGGFFSRLFGSRRSGRKRKTGGKETEEAPHSKPRRDASQEDREEPKAEPAPSRAPEPEPELQPARAPVPSERPTPPTEVVSGADAVDRAAQREPKETAPVAVAPAPTTPAKEVNPLLVKREALPSEEDTTPVSPQKDEAATRQEERDQRSPEVAVRPRSLLRTGSRSVSQGSETAEPAGPLPQTPPAEEQQPEETVSEPAQESLSEPAPEQDHKEQQKEEKKEEEESPPVLRRRRATPEKVENRSSQPRRSSGSQKLSWMEELRKTPPRDGAQTSSGHELRKTFVKEEAVTTPSAGEEVVQRTPSWVREELRNTPTSGHELRRTWIKEHPKTPPSSEETMTTPLPVKDEQRKSSPPPAVVEEVPRTPSWVTEELQKASAPSVDPTPIVPVRPARARPARRPVSSADPTLPSPVSTSPTSGSPKGLPTQNLSSSPTDAEPRRRVSALVFGGAEPASPSDDSGPGSLDSTELLTDERSEPEHQSCPVPAADPAVSPADGVRLGEGVEVPAELATGSPGRLSGAGSSLEEDQAGVEVSASRQSVEDVRRTGSSESVTEVKAEVTPGPTSEDSDPEEVSSGRPESASGSSRGSDKSGSRKSLAESLESLPSDSGRCDDISTPEESSLRRSLSSLTADKPDVTAKPRDVPETETVVSPAPVTPSSPTQEGSRLSPVEKTPTSEQEDGTPEFMKIHLHRVEAPTAMTTQVVVPKPKPRETPPKPTWKMDQRENRMEIKMDGKIETKLDRKVETKAETKVEKKVEAKSDHKFGGLADDVPEVVLIEKQSPRQPLSVSQPTDGDHAGSNVKPVCQTPTSPKSPKAVPEVPARPVLSAVRTPESSRHPVLGRQTTQEAEDSEPVVLRRRPPPPAAAADSSPDSELLKVFKRRSLKTVCPDESTPKLSTPSALPADDPLRVSTEEKESDRPRTEVVTASVSPSEARSAWNRRSVSMPAGGPKSPVIRDAGPTSIGHVLTETPSTDRPERPERPRKPAPPTQPRPSAATVAAAAAVDGATISSESPRVRSAPESARPPSAASAAAGPSGEQRRATQLEEDGAPTADWLKLVRERREQREQREQQTMRKLGQKELIIEPDTLTATRTPAPRSSRVLEMANTFQKLQPT